jgi:hypothetical protein
MVIHSLFAPSVIRLPGRGNPRKRTYMKTVQQVQQSSVTTSGLIFTESRSVLNEEQFTSILLLEREKAELRDQETLLAQIDLSGLTDHSCYENMMNLILSSLFSATREKDLKGWLDFNRILGIIFPHIDKTNAEIVLKRIKTIIEDILTVGPYPSVQPARPLNPPQGDF